MVGIIKPYTTKEMIGGRCQLFLVHMDKKCPINPTEYALLEGGLLDGGLNLEEASDIRQELGMSQTRYCDGLLNDSTAKVVLCNLRNKVENNFPELTLPRSITGRQHELRVWTRAELDELYSLLANPPEKGAHCIKDESGNDHIFVDGREVKMPSDSGFQRRRLALHIAEASTPSSQIEVNPHSRRYRNMWREEMGRELLMSTFTQCLVVVTDAYQAIDREVIRIRTNGCEGRFAYRLAA